MNDEFNPKNLGDPSERTLSTLFQAVSSLKELFEARMDALEEKVKTAHADLVRVPTDVEKAVLALKELQDEKFDAAANARTLTRNVLETRLDGMDKAIKLLQDTSNEFPHRIDEKILALEKVHEEKFNSIDKQFGERDVRTQQAAEASTTAVNAALQAQKESAQKQAEAFGEATQKAETQFTKQIEQIVELNRTENKGLASSIKMVEDRLNRDGGNKEGVEKNQTNNRLLIGVLIAIIGLIIGIAGFAVKLN